MVSTYHLPTAVHGRAHVSGHGQVAYAYEAGDVTPDTPRDAAVLAYLAGIGLAEKSARRRARRTEPAQSEE